MKLIIFVSLLYIKFSLGSLDDFDKRCIRACPDIYAPVCGTDGINYKIFPSQCVMESENCNLLFKLKSAFVKTSMSFCHLEEESFEDEECPSICPFLYRPVCATDGVTKILFPNKCELKKDQCRNNKRWILAESNDDCIFPDPEEDLSQEVDENKNECLKACNMNWDPICGFDGENYYTFGNQCDMEVQTCLRSDKQWKILRKGEC